ncbi:TetR/AcrR family transcriptional regulator [Novosphingobium sp.]|uniref:TetR/AcrR family transcriptional regulator n=1 Tax=Novosphingobium sp. TaxID=1874826 RepID=UPI0038B8D53A
MVTKPEALTCSPPKCRLGRASPDERREHILAVAARVFAEDGYGATSMSTIAARLGGSKATLYKYFPSKELLFEAVIQQRCGEVVAPLQAIAEADGDDLEALLVSFGLQFMTALFQPEAIELHRTVHAESRRFPEIAAMFMRSGPEIVFEALTQTLQRFAERGQIVSTDQRLAAGQFLGMVKADLHMRVAIGLEATPDAATIEREVRHAARILVRGLAPR